MRNKGEENAFKINLPWASSWELVLPGFLGAEKNNSCGSCIVFTGMRFSWTKGDSLLWFMCSLEHRDGFGLG